MDALRAFSLFVIGLGSTALPCSAPAQNIERSCSAGYRLHLSVIESADGGTRVPVAEVIGGVANPDGSFGFSATRGCGAGVPNRCRRRASEALMACMAAHAATPGERPAACDSGGISAYQIADLGKIITSTVCSYLTSQGFQVPRPYAIDVTIKGKVYGDDGCGGGDRNSLERDLAAMRVTCD